MFSSSQIFVTVEVVFAVVCEFVTTNPLVAFPVISVVYSAIVFSVTEYTIAPNAGLASVLSLFTGTVNVTSSSSNVDNTFEVGVPSAFNVITAVFLKPSLSSSSSQTFLTLIVVLLIISLLGGCLDEDYEYSDDYSSSQEY